jgi:hypothetical protein
VDECVTRSSRIVDFDISDTEMLRSDTRLSFSNRNSEWSRRKEWVNTEVLKSVTYV